MIVVCPSCRTRYRHEFDREAEESVAHCGGCDERFSLSEPKAPYRIMTPGLAAAVACADVRAVSDVACTSEVEIEIEVPADAPLDLAPIEQQATFEQPAPTEPTESWGPPPEPLVDPAAGAQAELPAEADGYAEAVPDEAAPVAPTRGGSLGEAALALVPSGLGAVVAYHAAGRLGQDPVTWASLGGAIGLLLGWACLLWITRGD